MVQVPNPDEQSVVSRSFGDALRADAFTSTSGQTRSVLAFLHEGANSQRGPRRACRTGLTGGGTVERNSARAVIPTALRRVTVDTTCWRRLDARKVEKALRSGPVLVIGPQVVAQLDDPSEVFACVDGSSRSEAVLEVAAAVAAGVNADTWLLTVMTGGPREVTSAAREQLHAGYLARLARRVRRAGITCNWEVLHDSDPAASIVRHVGTRGLLALTDHGAGTATGGLGPVTTSVLRHSKMPVLIKAAPDTPPRATRASPAPRQHRPPPRTARPRRRGAPRPPTCPTCGTDRIDDARFCGHCGALLRSRPAPEGPGPIRFHD